jgi:N-acetylglucosamine kinase-like BadF-type ATPase
MGPVLGVEGGGSHCHAVLAETSGRVLGIGANQDPANWDDVGIEAAAGAIRSCVTEALNAAGLKPDGVGASVFALAGVDFPMDEQLLAGIPSAIGITGPCRIVNDAFASLRAGTDQPHGVVVVAGTGSVAAGRNTDREEFRTLGMGPLLGDSGSASEVSEAAVTAVAAAYIGRGPETTLTGLLCERSGVASVVAFLEAASRQRVDTTVFSPEVVLAAEGGDAVARSILVEAGRSLGATAAHVVRRPGMEDDPFDLVLAGACSERRLGISSTASDPSCVRWLRRCGSNRSGIRPSSVPSSWRSTPLPRRSRPACGRRSPKGSSPRSTTHDGSKRGSVGSDRLAI